MRASPHDLDSSPDCPADDGLGRSPTLRALAGVAVAVLVAVVAGCGGSSKPAYCSSVSDFKSAVQGLTSGVAQNGVSALKTSVPKVESAGKTLVSDAKSDFGTETSALSASVSALGATARKVADPQTRKAALGQVPAEVAAVGAAFRGLSGAVQSNCG